MVDTKKFHNELIDLWDNYYNTEYVYDIIFVDDDYIEVKCENKKIANEFADFIMAYYKAPICYDFRKGNGCYQFSISPSLMIRESKKSARKSIKESKEINLIDNVANKLRKITDAYVDTYRGADWISLSKDEYTIKIIYMRNELSIELYKDGDFKDGEVEYASSLSDDDFSVNYIIDFIKNFIKNRNYLKNKISIKESKEFTRKSIKESKDSYKVKVLNEMLDAMAKDEYNIPKVGIYGVTKNINLDIGAIQLLIDYYK